MSVALDQALYSTLTADTGAGGVNNATTGATGGFHNPVAPQAAGFPRMHFIELTSTALYSLRNLLADHCYYQISAFAVDGQSEGVATAKSLIERAKVLLTDPSMTVTGKTLLFCRYERIIPTPPEWDAANNKYIHSQGMILEVWLA